jgi:CBS domain-containing membrane protein
VSNLRVRDLMTSDVLVVGPDDPVTKIRDLMADRHIRHVPVVDDGQDLVGVVSDRDLLARTLGTDTDLPLSLQAELLDADKVRDVMTWDVETVDVDEDVLTAAQVMLENKYGCLPVLEEGKLAGILTEADFVRFVATAAEGSELEPAGIRQRTRRSRTRH